MTFLLDQGLPRATINELANRGLTAEHVGNLGVATATDEEILEAARYRDAVVVTLDADFHALLAISGATTPSVIRIRIEGLKAADIAYILEQVVAAAASELQAGAAVSVTPAGFVFGCCRLPDCYSIRMCSDVRKTLPDDRQWPGRPTLRSTSLDLRLRYVRWKKRAQAFDADHGLVLSAADHQFVVQVFDGEGFPAGPHPVAASFDHSDEHADA